MFGDFYHIVLLGAGIYLFLLLFSWLLYRHFTQKLKEQEREKIRAILNAQEIERQEIAREVHDNLGPLLSITSMQIGSLIDSQQEGVRENGLNAIHRQLKEAIVLCRNISHDLTPYKHKSDLLKDVIGEYLRRVNQAGRIRVTYDYTASSFNMGLPVSISLCRILLEMINNTIRHAKANEIKVNISQSESYLLTDYADNGVGFNRIGETDGIGLKNIDSRIQTLKGEIQYFPKTDLYGMRALIKIPLNNCF